MQTPWPSPSARKRSPGRRSRWRPHRPRSRRRSRKPRKPVLAPGVSSAELRSTAARYPGPRRHDGECDGRTHGQARRRDYRDRTRRLARGFVLRTAGRECPRLSTPPGPEPTRWRDPRCSRNPREASQPWLPPTRPAATRPRRPPRSRSPLERPMRPGREAALGPAPFLRILRLAGRADRAEEPPALHQLEPGAAESLVRRGNGLRVYLIERRASSSWMTARGLSRAG